MLLHEDSNIMRIKSEYFTHLPCHTHYCDYDYDYFKSNHDYIIPNIDILIWHHAVLVSCTRVLEWKVFEYVGTASIVLVLVIERKSTFLKTLFCHEYLLKYYIQ